MNEQQAELLRLIGQIDDLWYTETYKQRELPEAEYRELLQRQQAKNTAVVAQIRELLAGGVSLDFTRNGSHTPLLVAVTHNDVALIELLIEHGADIRAETGYESPLHRAAEFGAHRVVRFLIEQGVDPRGKVGGRTPLAAARASRHSRGVVPLLVELLLPTKSRRPPPPKKPKELAEAEVTAWLAEAPPPTVGAATWAALRSFMDSVFVEEHSVSIDQLYESIEEHGDTRPELVFACVELIRKVARREPKAKTLKKLAKSVAVHHGDLTIDGKLTIGSLMVTGDLTVRGDANNVEGRRLFVGGNFTCESFRTEGPAVIGGDLTARVVDAFYNDYSLEVRGTLRADRLIVDHHVVRAGAFAVAERIDR
ncbi:ankyrin repeat domain-containing protein [Nannocystis punicea]|uniref:Ankyrin repeat domain-containing protein n=1 Tax=Nannocystis punicea TaxID=2995304 RepID=A0ABY7H220_9BACT|nr:ankyrin repeat domain-containing protein [Nannocystis poenicansa]WAS93300.1 ankyrin repeat domain-containing protein [Nannocystis poenicansa]